MRMVMMKQRKMEEARSALLTAVDVGHHRRRGRADAWSEEGRDRSKREAAKMRENEEDEGRGGRVCRFYEKEEG